MGVHLGSGLDRYRINAMAYQSSAVYKIGRVIKHCSNRGLCALRWFLAIRQVFLICLDPDTKILLIRWGSLANGSIMIYFI